MVKFFGIALSAIFLWNNPNAHAVTNVNLPEKPVREFRVGMSAIQMPFDGLDVGSKFGFGPTTYYDIAISQRSILAIHLAYRTIPGDKDIGQMGYGLVMQHQVAETAFLRHQISYGLLMQVVRVEGESGSGTAHDTRFAYGLDFGTTRSLFSEVSYHYSRLRHFGEEDKGLDFVEWAFGYRFY